MVDVAETFGPMALRRSDAIEQLGVTAGGYCLITVHRQGNTQGEALDALVEILEAVGEPLVFPLHPRTRAALDRRDLLARAEAAAIVTPPLGYLDFTALLASARVCLTDSGGVQKEAYLHRVPCLTLRTTSEWVETIELGWNRLVAFEPGAVATALARGHDAGRPSAALRRRPRVPADRRGDCRRLSRQRGAHPIPSPPT